MSLLKNTSYGLSLALLAACGQSSKQETKASDPTVTEITTFKQSSAAQSVCNLKSELPPIPSLKTLTESPSAFQAAFEGTFSALLSRKVEVAGGSIDSVFFPQIDINTMELSFFGALTRIFAEAPELGGNPRRGYKAKIWPAMVRVMMERTIPSTPDGILLFPSRDLRLAILSPEVRKQGFGAGARVFMVDKNNQLIGPDLNPLSVTGIQMADGSVRTLGNTAAEFGDYAHLGTDVFGKSLFLDPQPLSVRVKYDSKDEEFTLAQCFRFAADGASASESARDCFRNAGAQALADGVDLAKEVAVGGARGAAVGFVGGFLMPGIGNAAGAAVGAVTNIFAVFYNAFLRKEKISPNDIRRLMDFIAMYTYQPTYYGEVLPKYGQWYVTSNGVIRTATEFGNDNAGNAQYANLDITGNFIRCNQSVRVNVSGGSFVLPSR